MPRVLVVDDNPLGAELARCLLSAAGYEIVLTGGAREAYAVALAGGFELALIDLHMPGTDGVGLAAALRNDPQTSGIRLALFSATCVERDLEKLSADFDLVLPKPFEPEEFLRAINEALAPHRPSR